MQKLTKFLILWMIFEVGFVSVFGQKEKLNRMVAGIPVNYEEDSVGRYTLPDLLMLQNGKKVTSATTWLEKRRPEVLELLETSQFGKMPPRPSEMSFHVFDKGSLVFDGKAIRKQVAVYFTKDTSVFKMNVLIYLPTQLYKPVPLLLTVNFGANASVVNDSGVVLSEVWSRDKKKVTTSRMSPFGKLPVEKFISQGIGFATVYYGDIEPDFKDGINYGIRGHYLKPGTKPAPDEWGAIAAWAWGLSRAMDYFETDKQIDAKRIALQGTSRLGKTVLWTGARDTRFKMIIASCSGEGGAALSKRNYGESIKHLTDSTRYLYQFATNYSKFANKVDRMPFDSHMLLALMAPRPLLLQTGDVDFWSDPNGEFLAAQKATSVYNLFEENGPGNVYPEPGDKNLLNPLGYYLHKGGHGVIPEDWDVFIEFIHKYL
ncbi:MAG TPA: acetylxylan esterase [Bacteroidales bacterium]|nr:acetylxylan esterase [Bacteroidales bacterium]